MKDHSDMRIYEFLADVFLKAVLGYLWYRPLLFLTIPSIGYSGSRALLFLMLVLSAGFFLLVLGRRKNELSASACAVLPFGIYTLIARAAAAPKFVFAAAAVLLLCLAAAVPFLAIELPSGSEE